MLSRKGYDVLMIDLDAQANLTSSMAVFEDGPTIYEALTGKVDQLPIVLISGGLDLVPASISLSMIDVELSSVMAREWLLSDLLKKNNVTKNYDFVLLDCPPTLGLATLNAFTASTDIIIPLVSEVLPFKGLTMISHFIDMVKNRLNPHTDILGILLARWESSKLSKTIEDKLRKAMGEVVFQTKIRKNIRLAEAPLESIPIIEYDRNSNGAKDYADFAEEFIQRIKETEKN